MELMVVRKDFRLKFLYEGIHGQQFFLFLELLQAL